MYLPILVLGIPLADMYQESVTKDAN